MTERYRILFVCTGNTCRSPMAEVIARQKLDERGWDHVEVGSAGVAATRGHPASEGAVAAARRAGMDLSGHESAPLTEEEIEAADLILAMTPSHLRALEDTSAAEKMALLGAFAAGVEEDRGAGWSVPDPFGGGELEYAETFRTLEIMVDRALSRLEPVVSP